MVDMMLDMKVDMNLLKLDMNHMGLLLMELDMNRTELLLMEFLMNQASTNCKYFILIWWHHMAFITQIQCSNTCYSTKTC